MPTSAPERQAQNAAKSLCSNIEASLLRHANGSSLRNVSLWLVALLLLSVATAAWAQTVTTLVNFDITNGQEPIGVTLTQGLDGNLYGTTSGQGTTGASTTPGSVFKMTTGGTLTTLYSFCKQTNCTDGETPRAGLVLGTDGNFYGTTTGGGYISHYCTTGCGTMFKITPQGTLTTLYNFCSKSNCSDSGAPAGAVIQATDGNFYGTTTWGGTGASCHLGQKCGTVYRITPAGVFTKLYNFCNQANCSDGYFPLAGLIQGTDGNLYGTTSQGGSSESHGTVFKITLAGALTTVATLSSADSPYAGVIQAADGNFYGTTFYGGQYDNCGPPHYPGCGTVFKVTSKSSTLLYSFCDCGDGYQPQAPAYQGTDGNFYGTTYYGGTNGNGTLFQLTTAGVLTTLHDFGGSGSDGWEPYSGVMQHTNGTFYGNTQYGGTSRTNCYNVGCGTVFRLSMGLGPFIKTVPTAAAVATPVFILGTNLKGVTSVEFNGVTASFTVVSSTEIKTSVPAGATTGNVTVTMSSGTLTSNVAFQVLP